MEMLLFYFTDHTSVWYGICFLKVMNATDWLSFSIAPKWIKMFVLDEADEMLSRGFKDQIYEIFQKLSTNIQVG